MKKLMSLILAVMLMLTAIPLGAFTIAVGAETQGYYTYTVTNGEATITDVDMYSIGGDTVIPSTLGGHLVTSIGDFAFQGCSLIMSIVIPDTVTTIGKYAFEDCGRITEITIPDSVTSIGDYAFASCSSLETANISSAVTSIGAHAFRYCGALVNINVSSANTKYLSVDGILFNKEKTNLIRYPAGKSETDYSVPDGVTAIAACALEDSINLTNVTVADSVTSIGLYAFHNCDSLEIITLPFVGETIDGTSNTHFGYIFGAQENYTYNYQYVPQSLKEVVITNAIKIGSHAFDDCDYITGITLPNTLESIGYQAFYDCDGITEITIPASVINIGNQAFRGCNKLANVNVSSDNAVYSSLDGVIFDKNKTILVCYPNGRDSTIYHIPNSVITISTDAFRGNNKLTSVFMPNSVLQIDDFAFDGCTAFNDIWYFGTAAEKDNIEIGNSALPSVEWHFNTCTDDHIYLYECSEKCGNCDWVRESEPHTYDNACDVNCNICGEEREISGHVYDDNCDADCNICFTERVAPHLYDDDCDTDCNDCGEERDISHVYDNACDAYCNVCYTKRDVPEHIFDNICDATCNECGLTRFVPNHVYSDTCDATCNECGNVREVIHIYTNACDTTCDNCGETREVPGHVYDNGEDIDCNICSDFRNVISLSIDTTSAKLYYKIGEEFENDFTVKAFYDNGTEGIITNYSVSGFDSETAGYQTITVTYANCTDAFTVFVEGGTTGGTNPPDNTETEPTASWNISVDKTGVYKWKYGGNSNGDFEVDDIVIFDKQNNEVLYNEKLGGWPLVAKQEYTVKHKGQYTVGMAPNVPNCFSKIADTIFPDTSASGWYNDAVTYAVGRGIMTGYAVGGKFGTSDGIQRQDFLVMLARLDGVDLSQYESKHGKFPDVQKNSYYEAAVMWGYENGIVTGYNNGKFGVGDKITREQMVTFLYRYAKYKGLDTDYSNTTKQTVSKTYTDYKNVTSFAVDPVLWALENKVINGKNATTIAPQGNAQRCEVAQIMYNIFLNDIF